VNPFRTVTDAFDRERPRWPYWAPVALAASVVAYFLLPFEPSLWALAVLPVVAAAAKGRGASVGARKKRKTSIKAFRFYKFRI
jgi:hypothetical protein